MLKKILSLPPNNDVLRTKIFGCKTNKYYAEKWLASGELVGLSGVLVVSCVVTDQAKARWVKYVTKEVGNLADDEYIFLSGCGTLENGQLDPEFWEKYPQLLAHKQKIQLLGQDPHPIDIQKHIKKTPALASKLAALQKQQSLYTRRHVVIQTGCDTFCTFCATIHARGRHKNREALDIIDEIQSFEKTGGKEIVITGINLGAWGASSTIKLEEARLDELLLQILEQTQIPRIRISSTGIEFVSDKLLKVYEETRINPHFHFSVQSASDSILKSMNRKYDRSTLLDRLEATRNITRPDGVPISIGADMIVGFPGETEQDHAESVDLIKDYGVNKLHAFPFSDHTSAHSVPAAKFVDQIDQNTKYERLREMIAVGDDVRSKFLQENIEKPLQLLVEKCDGENYRGWSENYIWLDQNNSILQKEPKKNTILTCVLTKPEEKSGAEEKPSII